MNRLASLSAAVADAEQRLLERRRVVKRQARELAAHARRRLASPVALLAALGAGFLLASRTGRSGIGKAFAVLQLTLAALSALAAARK
jgi:hypothetical protein